MAEYPALPLFTDAFLADTLHLNTVQIGAYMLLLMAAWRAPDCTLPNDDLFLSRICRFDKRTWSNNREILMGFWHVDGARLFQKRLKDERNYVEQKRNKNSEAGKASALKRLNRGSTNVQPDANVNSTPTPTPTPTKKKEPKGSKKMGLVEWEKTNGAFDPLKTSLAKTYSASELQSMGRRFVMNCEANGRTYVDFNKAFASWDWDAPKPKAAAQRSFIDSEFAPMQRGKHADLP